MVKATLIDLMTNKEYPLPENFEEYKIGRIGYGNDIDIPDKESLEFDLEDLTGLARKISRHHCIIRKKDDDVAIMDNNSTNGIYINGKKIESMDDYILKDQDKISLGKKYKLKIILTSK